MPPNPDAAGRVPLPPPPRERIRDRLRRWRATLEAFTGLPHWLIVRGFPFLVFLAALFLLNGFLIGWRNAYDVTIGITSPGDDKIVAPVPAWFLSVVGWLAAPAVAGAVMGATITSALEARRRRPLSEIFGQPPAPDEAGGAE